MATIKTQPCSGIIPKSNAPPVAEWALHYWYTLFAASLQANEMLTGKEVKTLINWFKGFTVALCCDKCRHHYKAHWTRHPYGKMEARNVTKSINWVMDLRMTIQQQKSQEAAAASASTANSKVSNAPSADTKVKYCSGIPEFPGIVYPHVCKFEKEKIEIQQALNATAINRLKQEECKCAMKPREYKAPTW